MKLSLLLAALALPACHQNLTMSDQKKLIQWERSNVFRNGRVLQYAAPGSVSREEDTSNVLNEKPPMSLALVERGRERFNIFCSECHGAAGDADGMVVQRGFPRPPSFHEARLVSAPDEHFVDVITNGYGLMYAYSDRVPRADRWAITAYIRALQRMRPPNASQTAFKAVPEMTRSRALSIGVLGLLFCLAGAIFVPRDALVAWLVSWLAWGSIPIGALAVLMLVALIPGSWRQLYVLPLSLAATLMPLVAISVIPLLLGIELLYPWSNPSIHGTFLGFKGAWLSTGFFVVRAIIYMAVLSLFAWGMLSASARTRPAIASAGIILYALIGSLIGIDFAETSEPQFHSSIYGLLALTNQWLAGISFAILIGLWSHQGKVPRAASGVLFTAILMWGYMHAMQYIVIWAGDIPREVRWYLERGEHGWGALAWILYGLQGLVSFAALLSPAVRSSRNAMMGLAALTLLMRLAENAWLVLPGISGIGWAVAPLILAASLAMLGLGWAGAAAMQPRTHAYVNRGWAEQQ